ncbi:putative NBD/HSP70 family sugar kinase [Kineococcus rhizosphaerae]|uniref:Putative NBD/HSP70 family sugar kinase n=1 Tax=Kineococcus rhizosphaerae TaxID=559628 RepID=A0A2T0R8J3_9ACTN|nr:putative NBD/HSP70 family sugar kinase [Kineococcus rhizosphaerae]
MTRRLRDENALAVLHHVWDLPAGPDGSEPAVTGTDLIAATGLSRATVHDVCEELIGRGWLRELPNERAAGTYTKGRPARRYAFDVHAGVVVGIDAGQHRIAARVGDLRGRPLADVAREVAHEPASTPAAERLEVVAATVRQALAQAGSPQVLSVVLGVPAPVGPSGRTEFSGNPYWGFVNADLAGGLSSRHGWPVLAENDANLAALAEGWIGSGRGVRHQVTLLAGERIGAGVVDDGRLLRGARGGVGEMRYLTIVDGVGSPAGLGKVLRDLVAEAGGTGAAEDVVAAAAAGEELAGSLLAVAADRLARVVVTLASLFDPERVVVAGGVAGALGLVERVNAELPRFLDEPRPLVVASTLGRDVVVLGAVRRALDDVRDRVLSLSLERAGS